MRAALLAAAMFLATAADAAETRFLNLSPETVGGRQTTAKNGRTWQFHTDGRFISIMKGKSRYGRWSINGAAIKISWENGKTSYYNPILVDGQTQVRVTGERTKKRRSIHTTSRIISIEAL